VNIIISTNKKRHTFAQRLYYFEEDLFEVYKVLKFIK